jgi:hypothetical protein
VKLAYLYCRKISNYLKSSSSDSDASGGGGGLGCGGGECWAWRAQLADGRQQRVGIKRL